jgi:hypothetical protein
VLSRIAARVVTGPIAFFAAFVIDLGAFLSASLWAALRRRLSAGHRH